MSGETTTAAVDLGAEKASGLWDWAIVAVVVVVAAAYLARRLLGRRGHCAGCGKSGCRSSGTGGTAAARSSPDEP